MSVAMESSFGSIEKELELAKNNMKDISEKIKRMYGKSENFRIEPNNKKNLFDGRVKRVNQVRDRFGGVQRTGKIFNRLGSKEDDFNEFKDNFSKNTNAPRVVNVETQSRETVLLTMQSKKSDLARNKRMFGSLLGTLQKFRTEEDKDVLEKRAKIEMKIEKQQLLDKEKIQEEKNSLIADQKRKKFEIKSLESKMELVKNFKSWEETKLKDSEYICTKTTPPILYLPKNMNPHFEVKLKESQEELRKRIEERRREVDEEIKQIEERLASDLKALEEGKLKKLNDIESENSDNNNSDDENTITADHQHQQRHAKDKVSSLDDDRKRKRSSSYSPEKILRSQAVVKKANN